MDGEFVNVGNRPRNCRNSAPVIPDIDSKLCPGRIGGTRRTCRAGHRQALVDRMEDPCRLTIPPHRTRTAGCPGGSCWRRPRSLRRTAPRAGARRRRGRRRLPAGVRRGTGRRQERPPAHHAGAGVPLPSPATTRRRRRRRAGHRLAAHPGLRGDPRDPLRRRHPAAVRPGDRGPRGRDKAARPRAVAGAAGAGGAAAPRAAGPGQHQGQPEQPACGGRRAAAAAPGPPR